MKFSINTMVLVLAGASSAISALAFAKDQQPPVNRVSIEKARNVATQAYPAKVQGEELEFEGGKWIYSFDLKGPKDKRVREVHVDAISGKLLDTHTETMADEQKERSEDAKEESKL